MSGRIVLLLLSLSTLSQLAGCATATQKLLPTLTTLEEAEYYFGPGKRIPYIAGAAFYEWDVAASYDVAQNCETVELSPAIFDSEGRVIKTQELGARCTGGYTTEVGCHIFVVTDDAGRITSTKLTGVRQACDKLLRHPIPE